MSICVLSDSHNNKKAISRAVEIIRTLDPDIIIHCGDLCDPAMFDLFDHELVACRRLYFVYGNNDYDVSGIDRVCRGRGFATGPYHVLTAGERRIYACHGHKGLRDRAIGDGTYDVVFSGHSHVREDIRRNRTRVVNPGALYRAARYSFVHYRPESEEIRFIEVPK